MADYYFDIETCSRNDKPNMESDNIIAITYQQIDSRTGKVKDKLNILKAWESSEEEILRKFYLIFNPKQKWVFLPIGFNLSFDFTSLIFRWRKIGLEVTAREMFVEHPYIDMQHILLICNNGSFSGCSLEKFTGKKESGSNVIKYYDCRDYLAIQNYIEDEADRFIKLYQYLLQKLPQVWLEYAKLHNLGIYNQ